MTEHPEWYFPVNQNGHRSAHENQDGNVWLGPWRDIVGHVDDLGGQLAVAAMRVQRNECAWCGFTPDAVFDGRTVTLVPECPVTYGLTTAIQFDLEIRSGTMVVRDDLRPVFDLPETFNNHAAGGLNTRVGQRLHSMAAAQAGFAYGMVGNTSPGLYRVDEDHYLIANPGVVWEGYDVVEQRDQPGELVASICTDTWSYNVADAAEWDRRLPEAKERVTGAGYWWRGTEPDRVRVVPGIYRFQHHYGELGFDRDGDGLGNPVVFAHIERRDLDA